MTVPMFEYAPPYHKNMPTRTADGEPWVRWKKPGWFAIGSREAVVRPGGRFWDVVLTVVAASSGARLDGAHTSERGLLCCGALGVSFASGYGQRLLHLALLSEPERFLSVVAPLVFTTGIYVGPSDKTKSGAALYDIEGKGLFTTEQLCTAIPGGSGKEWTEREKHRSRVWVTVVSKLLRDERMDVVQANFAKEVLPILLTERTRAAVRWPQNGAGDAWEFTKEQQALWALALVASHEDEGMTEDILTASAHTCGVDWSPTGVIGVARRMVENNRLPSERFRARFLKLFELMKEAQWTTE